MKVADLIRQLQKFEGDMDVKIWITKRINEVPVYHELTVVLGHDTNILLTSTKQEG